MQKASERALESLLNLDKMIILNQVNTIMIILMESDALPIKYMVSSGDN